MSDAFESEVMDDLFYDSAEGPARPSYGDEFEELDELEDEFEDFDSMEDAVADALDAEDTDEFFRRIRRIARGVPEAHGGRTRVAYRPHQVQTLCTLRNSCAKQE